MDQQAEHNQTKVRVGGQNLSTFVKFNRKHLALFAVLFGLVGGLLVWHSLAATSVVASIEAENMNLPVGAYIVNGDMSASGSTSTAASGHKSVKFTKNGQATSVVYLPSPSDSVQVVVSGKRCHSEWANVILNIDGKSVLSTRVSSGYWKTLSVDKYLAAGQHTIGVAQTNSTSSCDRNLYVDVVKMIGQNTTVTPVPTVSLSASPTSLAPGQSSQLTWSSTNATSCAASGAWSGSKPTSGSMSTGALSTSATYTLVCAGGGGTSGPASTTVSVVSATPPPQNGSNLYTETFDQPICANNVWGTANWGSCPHPGWHGDSATLYSILSDRPTRVGSTQTTDTNHQRWWMRQAYSGNIQVEADVKPQAWNSSAPANSGWAGWKFYLRRQVDDTNSSFYTAEPYIYNGKVYIQKKCWGITPDTSNPLFNTTDGYGGTYYTLASKSNVPISLNAWHHFAAMTVTGADGSVTITLYRDGVQMLQTVDRPGLTGCAPLIGGRSGFRSDFSQYEVDNFKVNQLP